MDSFVLWSYPIWVQCLNNFAADCRVINNRKKLTNQAWEQTASWSRSPPFPHSYTHISKFNSDTRIGEKVSTEVVTIIISESLENDRKCTISLTYYKLKRKNKTKTKRCLTGKDLSWCHNNAIPIHDSIFVQEETIQYRLEPLFCLNPCSCFILVLKKAFISRLTYQMVDNT